MSSHNKIENTQGLRAIVTARDEESINKAAEEGYWPLIKKVKPLRKIRTKFCVIQHKKTGKIEIMYDFRGSGFIENYQEYETVISWTYYYPYHFKSPFAAYLIPKDIEVGERVYIEDLIEDYVGASWNQGNVYRLESCEAIWTGSKLKVQFDPIENHLYFVG